MKKKTEIIYKRLNITLPENIADRLKEIAPYGKVSSFISDAIEEKVKKIEIQKLMEELKAGYISTRLIDEQIADDFDPAVGDGLDD